DPGDSRSSINEQLRNTIGIHAAILVQFFASRFCNRLNTALHGNTVGAAKEIKGFFIPEINPRLEADLHRALGDAFKKAAHIFADAEDLVDKVDVFHAPADQRIHFTKNGIHTALAEFVAEQRLIAEAAGPGAAAGELEFRAESVVLREDMMPVMMGFHRIIVESERAKGAHVRHTERRAYMAALICRVAAACDLIPGGVSKQRDGLIRFSA